MSKSAPLDPALTPMLQTALEPVFAVLSKYFVAPPYVFGFDNMAGKFLLDSVDPMRRAMAEARRTLTAAGCPVRMDLSNAGFAIHGCPVAWLSLTDATLEWEYRGRMQPNKKWNVKVDATGFVVRLVG